MEGLGAAHLPGPDHYKGKMEMTTGGETMVMNYEGQKLGQCDGTEVNFVAKKMMADAERQQKLAEQQMKFSTATTRPARRTSPGS